MLKPGIVKQLQVALFISILVNMIFVYQLIYQVSKPQDRSPAATESPVLKKPQLTEQELKIFIKEYLNNFFASTEAGISFVQEHSSKELFESNLKQELAARIELKIESKFELTDIYLESINESSARAFIRGQELFTKNDYVNREYAIELIIDTNKLQTTNIPKFEINS